MSVQEHDLAVRERITIHRARVLDGVRSHVRDIKSITGLTDVRQLSRWWINNRGLWLEDMASAAGLRYLAANVAALASEPALAHLR